MAHVVAARTVRSAVRLQLVPRRSKSSRTTLGAPPESAPSFADRLAALSSEDPTYRYKVDIGFVVKRPSRRETMREHVEVLKRNKSDKELEALARANQLFVPLDRVEEDNAETLRPVQARAVAEHYGVFEHLFGDGYFHPVVYLKVVFADTVPVFTGNVIKPSEAADKPAVTFKSRDDQLWTVVMTTPDGTTNEVERIHWMVANIQGNDLSKGEELCNYIQPLPFEGLGYLRYVFLLYKQETRLDFSDLKKQLETTRFFSTLKFYSKRQDVLTPAGLSFFVADWDPSVTNYFQRVLREEPPKFEYDFPEHSYKKQKWFPLKEPFNLYLDRYRDEKEIAQELLTKKLKMMDPFKGDLRPKYPFPNAIPFVKGTPSWLTNEIKKERLGRARYADYV